MSIRYEIKKENLSKIHESFLYNLFFRTQHRYQDICIFRNKNTSISLSIKESSMCISKDYPDYYNFNVTIYNIDTSESVLADFKIVEFQGSAIQGFLNIYYDPYDWLFSALKLFENNLYYFLSYYRKVSEKEND